MSQQAQTPLDLANKEGRGYQVGAADLGTHGFPKEFQGTTSVHYIGTEGHPHLARTDPGYQFDNIEMDRLITVALNREWQRKEDDPRRGILLMGPTGSGKTTYIRQRLARQGIPLVEMTWREEMETVDSLYTRELVGGDISIAYAAITQAAIGGYPVLINEIDAGRPGQVMGLNEVIDTGRITIPETGETIEAKRGFQVYATCNSSFLEDLSGSYAGTRTQNASVLNRFFKFEFGYPDEKKEIAFIQKRYPSFAFATEAAKFAALMRKASEESGHDGHQIAVQFSRRTLIDWLDVAGHLGHLKDKGLSPLKYALGPVIAAGRPPEEVASIYHLFNLAFGETP